MIVLSGDIGGTNTRLQLTEFKAKGAVAVLAQQRFKNAQFTHLNDIIATFKEKVDCSDVAFAGFAFAGPIVNGEVTLTNLPWHTSEQALAAFLKLDKVHFLNDFEAIGYGVVSLTQKDTVVLQAGQPRSGMKAIIGAGTGLGVALLQKIGARYHVMPTEGGHVDFPPTDSDQSALLAFLQKKFHRVSNERVISGLGIVNIYKYVCTKPQFRDMESPELQRLALTSPSHEFSKTITRFANEKHDPICIDTLDIFVRCYGTIAGNLALTTLPHGGIYITGGIAPSLLTTMQDGRFMRAFSDKGRMSALLSKIPVYLVLNTQIGLTGAAYYAAHKEK